MTEKRKTDAKSASTKVAPESQQENEQTAGAKGPPRSYSKTPMFTAANAGRYQRQSLIREIEEKTDTTLLCYVSGDQREIERDDVFGFVDLLHNVPSNSPVDLMLHTLGGDVDVAEKIMVQVRSRIGTAKLRVIVPNYSKSAGTLMALGAHELVMSESSELGMIDPQYVLTDERGNAVCTSVIAYLEAWQSYVDAVRKDPSDRASQIMLERFDPIVVRKLQGQRDRTRDIAMNLLNRRGAPSTQISEALMDLARWKSHGQMIDYGDAREIGLIVDYRAADDPVWQLYWHLLCLQRLEVEDKKKLFESSYVSQIFDP